MAGVKGSFAALTSVRMRVQRALTPELRVKLAQVLGAAAMKQLGDEFQKSRNPYGEKWAPLKRRQGKPLLDTGRMRASAAVRPSANGFELVITANYSPFHQYGVRMRGTGRGRVRARFRVPRRQMLPEKSTGGLGKIWGPALARQAKSFVAAHFKGAP